jgi:hypothetical protein
MEAVQTIKSALEVIPTSLWVGLFGTGALMTLITTIIANRHARLLQEKGNNHAVRLQELALTHDAEQRARERQMALRREIYLPAVNALTGLMSSLGKLADLSIPDAEISEKFTSNTAPLWRVQMVGGEQTIRGVSGIQNAVGTLFMESIDNRMALSFLKTDAEIARQMAQKQRDEIETCLELMKEYNLEGRNDKARWQAILARSEFATHQRDLYDADALTAGNALFAAQVSHARFLSEKLGTLTGLWAPAAIAMRTELESADAAVVIAQELEKSFASMRSGLTKAMDALEARFENAMQGS